jgi:hypothetical protein
MELMGGAVQSNLTAEARVMRHAGQYRAYVLIREPTGVGERELENAHCDVLMDSVALLIALSIPSPEGAASRPIAKSVRPALLISVQGRLLRGALPLTAAGAGAAVALESFSSVRLEVSGAYYLSQSKSFADGMLGARFQSFAVGARACRLWRIDVLEMGPCLGAELHHVRATAFGGMPSLGGSVLWWGPALGLLLRVRVIELLAVQVGLEAVVPLSRPEFSFSDVGRLHRVSALALQLVLAPEVRF